MTYHLATLAAKNAEKAYHFCAFENDWLEAEYWWSRLCYWQRIAQELQEKRLSPAA